MKILSCASFYGTGSSAITDLFSEYSNVRPASDFEFSFLFEPDGVADLEYNLVQNFNRNNSCLAIKRFKRFCKANNGDIIHKKWYKYHFENQYLKLSNEYIDSLIGVSYRGFLDYDLRAKGSSKFVRLSFWRKLLTKLGCKRGGILKKEYTYCGAPSEEKFLEATQKYVEQLLTIYNKQNCEYVCMDQLFPCTNIDKVKRYVPFDSFVFLVDRDPRDLFILCKKVWTKEASIPSGKDVVEFCKWFDFSRHNAYEEVEKSKIVLKLNFEDLIYKYSETVEKIEKFTGLKNSDHINKFSRLNPKRSVVNTQIWKRYPEEEKNIKYIEENLSKYLYDFPTDCEVEGVETKDKSLF